MEALAMGPHPETTNEWIGVLVRDMTDESAERLFDRVHDRGDPLTPFRLPVIWHQLCLDAFGFNPFAAARLAATFCSGWFVLQSWATRKGMFLRDMEPAEALAAVYAYLIDRCEKDEDIARLNRSIFRRSDPWSE